MIESLLVTLLVERGGEGKAAREKAEEERETALSQSTFEGATVGGFEEKEERVKLLGEEC